MFQRRGAGSIAGHRRRESAEDAVGQGGELMARAGNQGEIDLGLDDFLVFRALGRRCTGWSVLAYRTE
jgi:hypothetical protein